LGNWEKKKDKFPKKKKVHICRGGAKMPIECWSKEEERGGGRKTRCLEPKKKKGKVKSQGKKEEEDTLGGEGHNKTTETVSFRKGKRGGTPSKT